MQIPLLDTRRVTLSASGVGSVTFGPSRPGEKWTVKRTSVLVSTQVLEAQAKTYRGSVGPGSFISGTVSGSTGDTDDGLNEILWPGQYLTVQWTGGDANATATVTYGGTIEL